MRKKKPIGLFYFSRCSLHGVGCDVPHTEAMDRSLMVEECLLLYNQWPNGTRLWARAEKRTKSVLLRRLFLRMDLEHGGILTHEVIVLIDWFDMRLLFHGDEGRFSYLS